MSEKINWRLDVQVVGGPKISPSQQTITVDAYDKIKRNVGDQPVDIEVQPGDEVGRVQFLLINSGRFGDDLTYKVNGQGEDIRLNGLQLFIGDGAVELLAPDPTTPVAPQSLSFTNNLGEEVNIEILVGRRVTD